MAYLASHEPCQLGEEISGNQLFQRLAKQLQLPRLKNEKVDQKDQYCSIRSDFGSVVKSPCVNWTERRAAVLICLFEGEEGELRVILTKRSMKLSSYPGDVALPGGKFEKGDADDSATALREAMEEIGLEPNLVRVAATLEPFISQEDNHRCEAREWMGSKYILHLFDFKCEKGGFLIWGLTASCILIRVASIIYQRSPCFEAHLPDFQTIANLLYT
ncbi:hypothetical protein F2P56_008039 [Juglans regia]|uniref:Nudix hydrolase domain-containing protein n=1 Tax=Juglans regia TaxID=51240 RepID=A0A833Y2P5_JUGRE|nr:hypothetical protein F2P56_008039 [Juglans regia]